MTEYFDKGGNLITKEIWRKLLRQKQYPYVAKDVLADEDDEHVVTINTVWIGTVKRYGPTGPMIFRTIITHPDNTEEVRWYATKEEALTSHNYLVDTYMSDNGWSRWDHIIDNL